MHTYSQGPLKEHFESMVMTCAAVIAHLHHVIYNNMDFCFNLLYFKMTKFFGGGKVSPLQQSLLMRVVIRGKQVEYSI